jgi:hypothetical protein
LSRGVQEADAVPEPDYVDLTLDAPPPEPHRLEGAAGRWRAVPGPGFQWLFDGGGFERWQVAGAGGFAVVGDRLESVPGDEPGLFWCTTPAPPDFELRLDWLRWRPEDGSSVFVRFPRPAPVPQDPLALSAIERGFEVRFGGGGAAGADATRPAGAIVRRRDHRLEVPIARPPAEWNALVITVRGQHYAVRMNGELASELANRDRVRGLPSTPQVPSFIALGLSPGSRIAFRRIGIRAL